MELVNTGLKNSAKKKFLIMKKVKNKNKYNIKHKNTRTIEIEYVIISLILIERKKRRKNYAKTCKEKQITRYQRKIKNIKIQIGARILKFYIENS